MSVIENEMGWNQGYNQQSQFDSIEAETPSPSPPHHHQQQQQQHQQQQQQQQAYPHPAAAQYDAQQTQGVFPCLQEYTQQQQPQQQAWLKQEFQPKVEVDKTNGVNFKVSESDLALATVPGANFDPKNRVFSPEELKPQPIIRKRRKVRFILLSVL